MLGLCKSKSWAKRVKFHSINVSGHHNISPSSTSNKKKCFTACRHLNVEFGRGWTWTGSNYEVVHQEAIISLQCQGEPQTSPFFYWLCASQGAQCRLYSHGALWDTYRHVDLFLFPSVCGHSARREREKERRKRRKLLVVQDFMPLSTIAQKIYIYILTFLLQNMKSTLCILSWCSSYNNIGVTGLYTSSRSTEK